MKATDPNEIAAQPAPIAGSDDPDARPTRRAEDRTAAASLGGGSRARWYRTGDLIAGRYEVDHILGQGGFAVVYAAHDRVVDRMVAVKVLNETIEGTDSREEERAAERFRREARAAAMIIHPNVVTIHDLGIGEQYAQPFIVMEMLVGRDLDDELAARGPLAPARAIPLLVGALEGLAAGHARGIVHKDLKPSNLFLVMPDTPREKLCLFDFGIARLGAGANGSTGTGEMFGTAQYLAPEYVSHGHVSPALDVYQMGLILVEMLTGRKVVDIDVPITAALTHSSGSIPIPVELLRGPLGWVLRRALAHDPHRRFPDAHAFAAALAVVQPTTIEAPFAGQVMLLKDAAPPAEPDPFDGLDPSQFGEAMSGLATVVAARRRSRAGRTVALLLVVLAGVAGTLAFVAGLDRASDLSSVDAPPSPSAAASARAEGGPPAVPSDAIASDAIASDAIASDAIASDAGPGDADPPDGSPASARAERAEALSLAFEDDLRRCNCRRARSRLAELKAEGDDGEARFDAACAPVKASRCARALARRLEKAMAACPCNDDTTRGLVQALKRDFAIDRRQAWTRRCVVPGMPGSCAGG